jgi:hypothetical protein
MLYLRNTDTKLIQPPTVVHSLSSTQSHHSSPLSQDAQNFKHIVAQFTVSSIVEPPLDEFIHLLTQVTG